jgi:hypothetical protein
MRNYGITRRGRPRKAPPRPQEANPAWRAAIANASIRPGAVNRRTCAAQRTQGRGQCHGLAVRNSPFCYAHGGWRALPKWRKEDNRKWKKARNALRLNASEERNLKTIDKADFFGHSTGYDM